MKYSFVGVDIDGVEIYETSKAMREHSYVEKIEIFKNDFYDETSPHYLGKRIRFQNKKRVRNL